MSDITIEFDGWVKGYIYKEISMTFKELVEGWDTDSIIDCYQNKEAFIDYAQDYCDWDDGDIVVKDCDISRKIIDLEATWLKFRQFIENEMSEIWEEIKNG